MIVVGCAYGCAWPNLFSVSREAVTGHQVPPFGKNIFGRFLSPENGRLEEMRKTEWNAPENKSDETKEPYHPTSPRPRPQI